MSKKAESNNFTVLLDALGMAYSRKFARKMFEEHPHKNNMFGLSKMLFDYQIPNEGAMLQNANEVTSIEPPFVTQFENDLVVVEKITNKEVYIFGRGREITVPIENFREGCSGAVLVAEPDNNSIEPNFKENRRAEWLRNFFKITLITAVVTGILFTGIKSDIYLNPGLIIILSINSVGIFICYLLVKKQLHLSSDVADKICSMFNKNSDCNNVLQSKASKLFGLIGWSELGLGYFVSGTLFVLFFSSLMPYISLLSICALPYAVWSVWYQKVRAKQWCPLCLIVQILFILLFASNWIFGFIQLPALLSMDILTVALTYAIPFLVITLLLPVFAENSKVEKITYGLNHLKMNEHVFRALLEQQPHYDTNPALSKITFGNPQAETLVTVISNPHCRPCSATHPKIDKVITALGDQICVQFLFLNFRVEHIKDSGKFLISAYLNKGEADAKGIFYKWFEKEKDNINKTYEKYKFDLKSDDVISEQLKHEQWCEDNKIHGTPTLLINGYRLPEYYNIDDLIYI